MSLRVCMYCGETIAEKGNALSRDPMMCAFCSSMSDGMPESNLFNFPDWDGKMQVEANFSRVMAEPVRAFASS
jgi:hypothetical protein